MTLRFFSLAGRDENESDRQAAVDRLRSAGIAAPGELRAALRAAAVLMNCKVATAAVIDGGSQWFADAVGTTDTGISRAMSFCSHTVRSTDGAMLVPDMTRDDRFSGNPLVTGPAAVRAYAGATLMSPDGLPVGTFCVMDNKVQPGWNDLMPELRALAARASHALWTSPAVG